MKKVSVESYHKQWCDDNGLIMSGKTLSSVVGCSMQKLKLLIERKLINFPAPAKAKMLGNRRVNYYKRADIEAFIAHTDVKKIKAPNFDGKPLKRDLKLAALHKNGIPLPLYLQFMGSKVDATEVQESGLGHY